VTGSYEHGSEPSGSIKGGEFDYLTDYQLLNSVELIARLFN
jgi:hypothetical protein